MPGDSIFDQGLGALVASRWQGFDMMLQAVAGNAKNGGATYVVGG